MQLKRSVKQRQQQQQLQHEFIIWKFSRHTTAYEDGHVFCIDRESSRSNVLSTEPNTRVKGVQISNILRSGQRRRSSFFPPLLSLPWLFPISSASWDCDGDESCRKWLRPIRKWLPGVVISSASLVSLLTSSTSRFDQRWPPPRPASSSTAFLTKTIDSGLCASPHCFFDFILV